jgi:hypothetical protein
MSTPLYDIGIQAIALQDALYEAMGEITPEIEASMDALLAEGEKSLVSAAYVVDKLENDAEFCRAEAKRLTDRAASLERGNRWEAGDPLPSSITVTKHEPTRYLRIK